MIARTWHGAVPLQNRAAFEAYELATGVADTQKLPGNRGVYLHVVEQGAFAHFFLCTLWDDMESVCRYAGEAPEIAVTYPDDESYGLISDPIVLLLPVTDARDPFEGYR